jgi:hypothetical protein
VFVLVFVAGFIGSADPFIPSASIDSSGRRITKGR